MDTDITTWLAAWREGDAEAGERLAGAVYPCRAAPTKPKRLFDLSVFGKITQITI
jgi:hypothetical protein